MTDPRENCPWKCKLCLCYDGEIERLTRQLSDVASYSSAEQRKEIERLISEVSRLTGERDMYYYKLMGIMDEIGDIPSLD